MLGVPFVEFRIEETIDMFPKSVSTSAISGSFQTPVDSKWRLVYLRSFICHKERKRFSFHFQRNRFCCLIDGIVAHFPTDTVWTTRVVRESGAERAVELGRLYADASL